MKFFEIIFMENFQKKNKKKIWMDFGLMLHSLFILIDQTIVRLRVLETLFRTTLQHICIGNILLLAGTLYQIG